MDQPSGSPLQPVDAAAAQAQITEHHPEAMIEAGSDNDSNNNFYSDYESGVALADSVSISPSMQDYAFEHGRRYHKYHHGSYLFPNDEAEQAREDMKHEMVVNLCSGRLYYAPLDNLQNVLDIGTGTGIWAIDMGDENPSASILGIDISPIQPNWVPPNVKFMMDDAESPWLHPPNHFDLIHARHLNSSIKSFPKLVTQAYKHLKPGGWLEFQELHFKPRCDDETMTEDYVVTMWLELIRQSLEIFGVDLMSASKYAGYLRDAGFVNVVERQFKIPIGTWAKNEKLKMIGLYMRTVMYDGVEGISLGPLTKVLNWTHEEVEALLVVLRKALMSSSVHSYLPFYIVYGQKPLAEPMRE